ncbi:MAG: hypothetical protein QJR05_07625 [Thermoanaerobacterium sp.]|nr:hypothetical protein [Thermoanaerobacterium sp.]
MIYTVGFLNVEGVYSITSDFVFSKKENVAEDIIFINASGPTRENWVRESLISPQFHLEGIIPNKVQSKQIEHFLYKGGTVISSLVNPKKSIKTLAFKDELYFPLRENVKVLDYGDLLELEYQPYNWLEGVLKEYSEKAYLITLEKNSLQIQDARVNTAVNSVMFSVGSNHGSLIFTTLMNDVLNFKTKNDFQNVVKEVSGKGMTNVVAG